jgi:hypothetical protein
LHSISQFKPQELSNCVHALGKIKPDRRELCASFLESWSSKCVSVMSQLEPQDLANVIFGVAKLGLERRDLNPRFFMSWSEACVASMSKFNSQDWRTRFTHLGCSSWIEMTFARVSMKFGAKLVLLECQSSTAKA